ncbi:MAG TPA: RHS repeat-associated core domain-containing protein, partial [Allosphingosinicella sp.]
ASFAYDDLGRRISITRGNGTATSYSFDAVSRLSQIIDNPAGTTHDRTLGFGYNPAGQIVGTTRSNDLFAWAGHGSGTTGSTANGLNQLAAIGGTGTSHDARGNMTADRLGKTFGYSSENLLTSASGGVTLSYDPALRLFQVAGATTTRFAYDGVDLIAEYNTGNALQRRFVHGPGTDEPLVWYEGTGTTDRRFLHADERGSIVAVSNGSGSVTTVNTYDEYGKPGSGNLGRFQYTGQKWIGEVGLYDYKARMYHSTLGRFLQSDPIGYGAGMNMYAYVGGDPVNLVDPTGLKDAVPGSGGCNPGNLDENTAYVCGQRPPPDTMRSLMLLDSLFARPTELLPYDGPQLPGNPAECADEACEEAIVTSRTRAPCAPGVNCRLQYTLPPKLRFTDFPVPTYTADPSLPADYCGAGSSRGIPDNIGPIDLRGACATHDNCYSTAQADKTGCDMALGRDVTLSCAGANVPIGICMSIGSTYFWGVILGGARPFRDAQYQARRR